jgi:CxC2 like cysteine cluster associated with KDZ transposases
MWNGHFFEQSDILTHALCLDLSHYPEDCPSIMTGTETQMFFNLDPSDADDDLVDGDEPSEAEPTTQSGIRSHIIVVSSTGIFKRSIRWCSCAKSPDQFVQLLLRAKLFPASFKNPKTAFTFEVLDHFRVDALECNTAAMNFMSKLRRITDEAFPSRVPVSLPIHRT